MIIVAPWHLVGALTGRSIPFEFPARSSGGKEVCDPSQGFLLQLGPIMDSAKWVPIATVFGHGGLFVKDSTDQGSLRGEMVGAGVWILTSWASASDRDWPNAS